MVSACGVVALCIFVYWDLTTTQYPNHKYKPTDDSWVRESQQSNMKGMVILDVIEEARAYRKTRDKHRRSLELIEAVPPGAVVNVDMGGKL